MVSCLAVVAEAGRKLNITNGKLLYCFSLTECSSLVFLLLQKKNALNYFEDDGILTEGNSRWKILSFERFSPITCATLNENFFRIERF